jgi:hypothetical protein
MKKGYANIAHSIGKGIRSRTCPGNDPLPDRLRVLLDRLSENDNLENYLSASQTKRGLQKRDSII